MDVVITVRITRIRVTVCFMVVWHCNWHDPGIMRTVVMNYTGTKVPGFWEQPTRNLRDIPKVVVVGLFTTASP